MKDLHVFENATEFMDFIKSVAGDSEVTESSMKAVYETVASANIVIGKQDNVLVKVEDGSITAISYPELRGIADKRMETMIEDLDMIRKRINCDCDRNIPCNVCLAFRDRNKILKEGINIGT